MIQPVVVRDLEIGTGRPKICVPIVGVTEEAILEEARMISGLAADLVEWRIDWFEQVFDTEQVLSVLKKLRGILGNLPILVTFRTSKEGGEKAIGPEDYAALNLAVARSGNADLIDVEVFTGDMLVRDIIAGAHENGVRVVASNHDFQKTPDKEELLSRLLKMQELGADLPKIAVMPQNKSDVLTLLAATLEMHEKYADRPIITMSMSASGVISRLCGEVFGSALTFGAAKKASAPGQMGVQDLNTILELLHQAL